jgi:hypothetical protein
MEKGQKANLSQAQGRRVIWVPSSTTIMPTLNGPSWQGGHGKMHKVHIENFDQVLSYIEFVNMMLTLYGGIGLFHKSFRCHKVLCHPCRNHGGVPIVVERRHILGNVEVP